MAVVAKFVFRLEPVLDQRRAAEEQRQRDVAALERDRIALEERIRDQQRSIVSHKEDMREALGGGESRLVDTAAVRLQSAASLSLVGQTQRLALQLAGLYQRLERARAALREATAARKAVELLKERQREAWRREQDRKEALAVDELVTMRSGRPDPHDEALA